MRLTLRYGNAENLKGFAEAGRIPARADDPGHEDDDPPADRGRARQELRPARRRDGRPDDAGIRRRRGAGSVTFALETKRANLPAVLEILRQILREPTCPASEFEVLKTREIAGIEQGRTDPMRLGFNRIPAPSAPYPSDDVRYVPTIDEQLERTQASSRSIRSARCTASTSAPITASSWSSATSSPRRSCRSWPRPSRAGRPRSPTRGSSGRSRPA